MVRALDAPTTIGLKRHPHFGSALYFTLRHGVPVCYLRPIAGPKGRCAFSFPLFVDSAGATISHDQLCEHKEAEELSCAKAEDFDLTESDLKSVGVNGTKESGDSDRASTSTEEIEMEPLYNSYGR